MAQTPFARACAADIAIAMFVHLRTRLAYLLAATHEALCTVSAKMPLYSA